MLCGHRRVRLGSIIPEIRRNFFAVFVPFTLSWPRSPLLAFRSLRYCIRLILQRTSMFSCRRFPETVIQFGLSRYGQQNNSVIPTDWSVRTVESWSLPVDIGRAVCGGSAPEGRAHTALSEVQLLKLYRTRRAPWWKGLRRRRENSPRQRCALESFKCPDMFGAVRV